jgi:hypothetical protein
MLAERHPESAPLLKLALGKAQRDGRPLGETLLELDATPFEQIRDCLLDQALTGIGWMTSQQEEFSSQWHPLTGTFDERLTFSPLEIFQRATNSLWAESDDNLAYRIFKDFGETSTMSILGISASDKVAPVAVNGLEIDSVADMLKTGKMVSAVMRPPALLAAEIEPNLLIFGTADDLGVLCTDRHLTIFLGGLTANARSQLLYRVASFREENK